MKTVNKKNYLVYVKTDWYELVRIFYKNGTSEFLMLNGKTPIGYTGWSDSLTDNWVYNKQHELLYSWN